MEEKEYLRNRFSTWNDEDYGDYLNNEGKIINETIDELQKDLSKKYDHIQSLIMDKFPYEFRNEEANYNFDDKEFDEYYKNIKYILTIIHNFKTELLRYNTWERTSEAFQDRKKVFYIKRSFDEFTKEWEEEIIEYEEEGRKIKISEE